MNKLLLKQFTYLSAMALIPPILIVSAKPFLSRMNRPHSLSGDRFAKYDVEVVVPYNKQKNTDRPGFMLSQLATQLERYPAANSFKLQQFTYPLDGTGGADIELTYERNIQLLRNRVYCHIWSIETYENVTDDAIHAATLVGDTQASVTASLRNSGCIYRVRH